MNHMYTYILYKVTGSHHYNFIGEFSSLEEAKSHVSCYNWESSFNGVTENFWMRGWNNDGFTTHIITREFKGESDDN